MALTPAEIQARYRDRHPERIKASRIAGKERDRVWRENNRERLRKLSRESYHRNKEKILAKRKKEYDPEKKRVRTREHYEKNKERLLAERRAWRIANPDKCKKLKDDWIEKNKDYYLARSANYQSIRNRACSKATPEWANKFFIKEIYHLARLRTKLLGVEHHVDHIVPLQSPFVCGLHCEANLRVIPASVNRRKKNYLEDTVPIFQSKLIVGASI